MHNLALYTKASNSLLPTDTTPASFWITFPTNSFYNNSAAGSDRYGFWFDLPQHPTGPSTRDDICPTGEPLGAFEDNTAHSNVQYGVRIFDGWMPVLGDACRYYPEAPMHVPDTATLLRYTGYRNGRTGAVSTVTATDLVLVDILVTSLQELGNLNCLTSHQLLRNGMQIC